MAYENGGGGKRPPGSGSRGRSDTRQGGYRKDDNRQGGYRKDDTRQGGYRKDDTRQGGYRKDDTRQGGYRKDDTRQGGYRKDDNRQGDSRQGGYRKDNTQQGDTRQGSYRKDDARQGGYRKDDTRQGGYRKDDTRQGGYRKDDNRQGGYRKDGYRGKPARPQETDDRVRSPRQPPAEVPVEVPVQPGMPAPDQTPAYFLMGRNAVREALKSGRSIDRILVIPEQDGSLRELTTLAKERGIPVQNTARTRLDTLCMPFGHNGRPGNHQGILAMVPEVEYSTLEDILALAAERGEPPFLLLLDEINDPHNLGSMLRSAACAGVHGVIIPKRRAASITAAVAKASAGAVEYVKIAKVSNLSAAIETLKAAGVWIAGGDTGGTPMYDVDLSGPLAIVVGNEGEGISRLVRERCDHLVRIPLREGEIDSLNASVAAAVLLFEKVRQDTLGKDR